jgi:pyrroline-5-carboxylate reductase
MHHPQLAFIGGGNMARSLIGGLVGRGHPPDRIAVAEPVAAAREALARDFGVRVATDAALAAAGAAVVVLAVKPQVMRVACAQVRESVAASGALLVSVAAGIRVGQIEQWTGTSAAVVRAMPNTPSLVGAGVSGLYANAGATAAQRELASGILGAAGEVVWIGDEALMDAVTAVSGSGPAYFFLLMEALEQAAAAQGLPADTARALVLQTALGAARMAREGGEPPATLRERVTSPGGTTQAALDVLESGGLRGLVSDAVARATARGRELSDQYQD